MQLSHVGRNALSLQKKDHEAKETPSLSYLPLLQIPERYL